MDRGDIAEAIVLFQYSSTARSGTRAQAVSQRLADLYRRNEIGFHVLARASLRGRWREGRAGHDLQLNTTYFDRFERLPAASRLAALSLILVHEATHATVNFTKLYDEMAARMLPILYFRELSGPGVFNEANDPPRPGRPSRIVRLAPGSFPEFEEQSEALRKDQLIDYILSIRSYTRSRYITPQWIIDNLTHWRGLRNRWPETRGLDIRLLADSADIHFTRAIIDVMESVDQRADWNTMMEAAGSLRSIQIALDDLSARPQYGRRIVALERRWGVYLRERIPAR
jgi:hypothetical protein